MHINQFPEDVQKAVYKICLTAIKRAIEEGTYGEEIIQENADENLSTLENTKKAAL